VALPPPVHAPRTFPAHGPGRGRSLAAQLPTGWTDGNPGNNTQTASFTPSRKVDVGWTELELKPFDARPGKHDIYTLSGTVAVGGPAADRVQEITYTISGGAFVTGDQDNGGAAVTESTTVTRPVADATPSFRARPDDPAEPGTIAITASPADAPEEAFEDTAPANDTAKAEPRRYDGSIDPLSAEATADEKNTQTFTTTLHTDGFTETETEPLTFSATGPVGATVSDVTRDGDELSFTVTGLQSGTVSLTANLPTGWTDADSTDNIQSASYTLSRKVDVGWGDLELDPSDARPGKDDTYSLTGSVNVTGPAKARVQEISYTISGGSFADGDTTTTRPATDSAQTFQVRPTDAAKPGHVSITVAPADAAEEVFEDTDPANDTATAELRRYDVSIGPLSTGKVDGTNTQTFSATLDDDGFGVDHPDEQLGFTATGPDGAEVSKVTNDHGTLRFTVTGSKAGTGRLSVALPNGWTDADAGNNTSTAEFVPAPKTDVRMDALTLLRSDKRVNTVRAQVSGIPDDARRITFTLDNNTGNNGAKFVGGADGATGEGNVDCVVSDATHVTCTRLRSAFFVDMDIMRPEGQPNEVKVEVTAVDVEDADPSNNTRSVELD
jgi:hypothetical protein